MRYRKTGKTNFVNHGRERNKQTDKMTEYIVPGEGINNFGDLVGYKEVVRCKDCVYWWKSNGLCLQLTKDNVSRVEMKEADYCSKGRKKRNEEE